MKLYKYLPYDSSIIYKVISKGELLYSRASLFNDPFDLNPSFPNLTSKDLRDYRRFLLKSNIGPDWNKLDKIKAKKNINKKVNHRSLLKLYNETYKTFRNNSFICCLSEDFKSTLMWSHYAHNHSGICVEIELPETNKILHKVIYSELRPEFPFVKIKNRDKFFQGQDFINQFIIKNSHWEYEKEWRILYLFDMVNDDMKPYDLFIKEEFSEYEFVNEINEGKLFSGHKVTKIILGVNFKEANLLKMKTLCNKKLIPLSRLKLEDKIFDYKEVEL